MYIIQKEEGQRTLRFFVTPLFVTFFDQLICDEMQRAFLVLLFFILLFLVLLFFVQIVSLLI